ncbi:MAG: hypothetical protein CVU80_00705 [Elusimicrobia bacterium HGW-Elusimicrobia-4]|nr:MAG: hypothetical protein CVU80_00705 [Elusimicrobia bacterium HGW-Elusimicrobia-4]
MKKLQITNYKLQIFLLFLICNLQSAICNRLYCEPAMITGNQMKMLQKGDILEFIGNVKFVQQNLTITADKMKSNEKTGIVEGYGNITVHYSSGSQNTYAWGNNAKYNKNSGFGIFTGNIKVKKILHDTTASLDLTCDELEVFEFGDRFHAIKNVKIIQPQTEATSNEAFYNHKTKEILLTGGPPKITKFDEKGQTEFSADQITIVTDKEVITSSGNVKAKMVLK